MNGQIDFGHTQGESKPAQAPQTLAETYARQWYRLNLGGRRFKVWVTEAPTRALPALEAPLFLVCPTDSATASPTAADLIEDFRRFAATPWAQYFLAGRGTCHGSTGGWFELLGAFTADSDRGAVEVASTLGQPALVRIDAEGLSILPAVSGFTALRLNYDWEEEPLEGCPVRLAADGLNCKRHGGPWTSASMRAGAEWSDYHEVLRWLHGCGPCAAGAKTGPGTPIKLKEFRLATRHRGAYWDDDFNV